MSDSEVENTQGSVNTDPELLDELIVQVKSKPILYDCSTNSNRNRLLREVAWDDISKKIGQTVIWIKAEWTKLRAAYNRRKKCLKGKTGQARQKIESWTHFHVMQFLDDFDVVASTTGNLTASEFDNESPGSSNSFVVDTENEAESGVDSVDNQPDEFGEKPKKDITYSQKRHRRPTASVDEEIVNFLKKPRQQLDEHHHFGMAVAEQLRQSAPEMASYAKCKIQQILHECRFPLMSVVTVENVESG